MSREDTPDRQLQAWLEYVAQVRERPGTPFEEQHARFEEIYRDRPPEAGPPPAWAPDPARVVRSNLGQVMSELGIDDYRAFHHWTVENREAFWRLALERLGVLMTRQPNQILDLEGGPAHPRWLPGAELNTVDSCFRGDAAADAIVFAREGDDEIRRVSHGELESLVDRVAAGLLEHGFRPGDGIALFLPMNVECVAAYLGVVRAGCHVVSIADSFAAEEVARRLRIGAARGVVTVDRFRRGGRQIPVYERAVAADAPRTVVIPCSGETPSLRRGDLLWNDLLGPEGERPGSFPADPYRLTNVLFSSGTTGDPKAIPWNHLTPLKAAMDGHFHHDLHVGDVICWPTNVGWMMGPWLIYAALVNGAAIALYEGSPAGAGFPRFVEHARVNMLGVVPSLVRTWRDSGVCDGADWGGVEVLSSTGEPSNRGDSLWLMSRTGYRAPVIEYCGGTEIGGGYLTGTVVQPASPATFTTPALGLDVAILDDAGNEAGPGVAGELYLVPPSIGLSQELLNADHDDVYYADCPEDPGGRVLRRHGDQVERLSGGYFRAQGRADDTMNLGGIKVSSLELERILDSHPAVYESAAVAVQPEGEGAERLVLFIVPARDEPQERLAAELQSSISEHLNPLFRIHDMVVVDGLPRTASNKLMRRSLRAEYTEGANASRKEPGR